MDQKKIGTFLKALRKEKGITQEEFAEKINVSGRTVSRWETGNNLPDISLLVEIAEFFDVSIPEIINGERKSENMKEEVKETVEVMADYAGAEKEKIIKDIQKQSIIGVASVIVVMILELQGWGQNVVIEYIHTYLQVLAYVSVFMILMFSTGLSYKMKQKNKLTGFSKIVQIVFAGIAAFAIAVILKYIFVAIGI